MPAVRTALLLAALLTAPASTAIAQFEETLPADGPQLGKAFTSRYQAGVKIDARTACQGIVATFSVPTNWPEQTVEVSAEEISPAAKVSRRTLAGDVEQVLVSVPVLPAGQSAEVRITYEITRHTLPPPEMPEELIFPKEITPADRRHLGNSPFIEVRHGQVRAKAKEILKAHAGEPAFKQVEAIYDWVRENIEGREVKLQGAAATLRSGHGQIEDLTSLFIALCRASDIPARTVWIPEGCYAEFLLADASGKTHWLPCHLTGPRQFGESNCEYPILQKGDNIRVPEEKEAVRFVPEFLKGAGGRPEVEFIRRPLPAE
jgi:hypothetical protein